MNTPAKPVTVDAWIAARRSLGESAVDIAAAYGQALARDWWPDVDFVDAPALLRSPQGESAAATPLPAGAPAGFAAVADSVRPNPMGFGDGMTGTSADLGVVYERALALEHRHEQGIYYTPIGVASLLVDIALNHHVSQSGKALCEAPPLVCDPAMGGGAFLLAAAGALYEVGVDPQVVVAELLWGIDVDPNAVLVAEAALALWAFGHTRTWVSAGQHLVCADALASGADAFDRAGTQLHPQGRFDVVVGNPPFQGQLGSGTARASADGLALRERWGVATGPYADTAAFFLLVANELTAGTGTSVLLQPHSTLATDDSAPIRERLDANLAGLWLSKAQHFLASVEVCAPVLGVPADPKKLDVWLEHTQLPPFRYQRTNRWATVLAYAMGTPEPALPQHDDAATIGSVGSATAGFRDQFYGLAPATVEAVEVGGYAAPTIQTGFPRLVTVGMIDPLHNRWGSGTFRYAKKNWQAPVIDTVALSTADPAMWTWVNERMTPKLVVATQTKVLEVIVDTAGVLVPSTPAIALHAPEDLLWKLAAAVTSPVLAATALGRAAGGALSADAIKLSARQLLDLPLPTNAEAWERGAELARSISCSADAADPLAWKAGLEELGTVMCAAYEVDPHDQRILAWWLDRLPIWR